MSTVAFKPLAIAVLTISDTRTLATDSSGQLLVDKLTASGHQCIERDLVPDSKYAIRAVVSGWILDEKINVILITQSSSEHSITIAINAMAMLLKAHQEHEQQLLVEMRQPQKNNLLKNQALNRK